MLPKAGERKRPEGLRPFFIASVSYETCFSETESQSHEYVMGLVVGVDIDSSAAHAGFKFGIVDHLVTIAHVHPDVGRKSEGDTGAQLIGEGPVGIIDDACPARRVQF